MESSDQVVYMDKELRRAACEGDVSFLEKAVKREKERGDNNFEYFLRRTNMGKFNVLQSAIARRHYEFVEAAVKLLPTHVILTILCLKDWDGDTPLHQAALGSTMEIVKLLDDYVRQNGMETMWRMQNHVGETPLHCAARKNLEAVKYLVEKHPDLPSIPNKSKATFLHYLAAAPGTISTIKAVDEIWGDEDLKLKMWSMKDADGNTPLHLAAKRDQHEVVKYLLEKHPGLASIFNNDEGTFLHVAAASGSLRTIKAVDEIWDDEHKMKMWRVMNADGNTPLLLAINKEQGEVVKYLVEKHPGLVSILNSSMAGSIHLAATKGYISIFKAVDNYKDLEMKLLLSMKNAEGNTPLHSAAIHAQAEVVQFLVERQPQLALALNNNKETPLHLAIKHYETVDIDIEAITRGDIPKAIKILVERESGVARLFDADGYTPLHRAASLCTTYNVEVVRFILQHSSQSADVLDGFGNTILHLMINNIASCKQGANLLTISDVNALRNTVNHQGKTPLDLACENNFKMVRILLDGSINHSALTTKGNSAALLIPQHNDLQMMKKQRTTMEEYGLIEEESIIRKRLQKFGMNFLFSRDSNKRNVLHKLLHINRTISITVEAYVDLVHEILIKHPMLVCQKDVNGDTPIHVLVRNPSNIQSYLGGFELNSSSLETSNFLSKLLELCRVYYYKARASAEESPYNSPWLVQNIVGNTPLHEALTTDCAGVVVRQFFKLDIENVGRLINKKEETALHLLAGRLSSSQKKENVVEEDTRALIKAYKKAVMMPDKSGLYPLHRAIRVGNLGSIVALLDEEYHEATVLGDAEGITLLHEIIDQSSPLNLNHVAVLISKAPVLVTKLVVRDQKGKTPLHLAIERQYLKHAKFFLMICSVQPFVNDLFEMQDDEGNTVLHLAILGGYDEFVLDFLELSGIKDFTQDSRNLLSITNNNGKTALHLAIEHQRFAIAKIILEASTDNDLQVHDNEENTPLHRAIHGGHLDFISHFIEIVDSNDYQDLRKLLSKRDKNGKTPLHQAFEQCLDNVKKFLEVSTFEELKVQDNVGNTPLHLAILGGHFGFVLYFLRLTENKHVEDLLEIENKDGRTPSALIGSKKELPSELKNYLMKEPSLVGITSMYGIANTEMKDYVNTMGVIAALLATITFTTALSVPGGPKQEDGTPILIKHASFQAFMFFDVLTMCLSTMVLFCLLWIITDNGRQSVMLMDFSIWLLQISFYTTLLTFMTGIYAANFAVKSWIVIYTMLLCSSLILLMQKKIVSTILGPFMCKLLVHFNFEGIVLHCKKIFQSIVLYCKTMLISSKKLLSSQQEEHSGQV